MLNKAKQSNHKGFTLIELLLAMTFFSTILMIGAITFVQLLGIYSKGVTLKQITQIGRTISDDLVRSGNQSSKSVVVDTVTKPRCLVVGQNAYIWSYATDTAADDAVQYKYSDTHTPIAFARFNTVTKACPDPAVEIARSDVTELLGDAARVYASEVKPVADDIIKLKLTLGTYGGSGSRSNPVIDPDTQEASCRTESIGNYCAFGTYETIVYLPNNR